MATFTGNQLEAIAAALGDTTDGLIGGEIPHLLAKARMKDTDPTITKRHRLYNAFVHSQNALQDRTHVLAFIRFSMKPERYIKDPERFERMRSSLNHALAFAGLERFPIFLNRLGFPNQRGSDSNCMLAKEAGMHVQAPLARSA